MNAKEITLKVDQSDPYNCKLITPTGVFHFKYGDELSEFLATAEEPQHRPTVSEEEIDILSKFLGEARFVNDPDLEKLDKLDALHKKVYSENRIKLGFGEAALLARKAAIKELLNR